VNALQLSHAPVAKAEMLIRKPVAEVFEAFMNPETTTKIWFTKSSGRLELGKSIRWDWEMYGASAQVSVKAVETNRRISIEWSSDDAPTNVEFMFASHGNGATFVSITNAGFTGSADGIVKQALDSTEGFTLVLAGLKALLEHGILLNLVGDRFPAGLAKHA
jgi:uncharacterized protein YndB with AHSA1/START domain